MRNDSLSIPDIENMMNIHDIKIVYYIDRLHFYTDTKTHKNKLAPILESNPNNKLEFKPLSHHEHLDKFVQLFQPDLEILSNLSHTVKGDYSINYIEFAVDFLVPTKKARTRLQYFFDRHIVYKRNSNKATESNFRHPSYSRKSSLHFLLKKNLA